MVHAVTISQFGVVSLQKARSYNTSGYGIVPKGS
jgi:hypothetical protein